MLSEVPAGDEDEERGEVVGDKEIFAGDKDYVMEEIDGEIADAEVEHPVLETGVGRRK